MQEASNRTRVRVVSGIVVLVALGLLTQLYFVQIAGGEEYRQKATGQYTQASSNVFNRGSISLTSKEGKQRVAVLQESGFVLAANGRFLDQPAVVFSELKSVLPDLSETEFMEKAVDTDDPYIIIKHRLTPEEAADVRALRLEGVGVYPEKWRRYPYGTLAANVLGYAGYSAEGDARVGTYGVEKEYNDVLSRAGDGLYTNPFAQVFSGIGVGGSGDSAGNIELTIEPDVQSYLEKLLADTADEWNTEQVMGVVIDPNTGKIKAMAVNPTFNPNTYGEVEDQAVFANPIVQSRFEMGSIIKALTMAAGLDAGVVTPETTYNDTGSLTLNGATLYNYDLKGRGPRTTMQTVLDESLNTGAAFVAGKLGHERMREYFYGYGMNEKTDINLPGEIGGSVANLSVDRDLEFATASFGQGIAITPIQTVRALSVLANGGRRVTPQIIEAVEYEVGGREEVENSASKRVLKESTSEEISRMLVKVADQSFYGQYSRDRHSIALKTGTAQIAKPGGGYYENLYNHTYFGYFPAYEPKYLIFLMARRPQGARYASQTLTEPFFNMTDFLINYYNVSPDR